MAKAFSFFWDTNILVDLLLQRDFELDAINELYLSAEQGDVKIYVSESVITTAIYVCRSIEVVTPLSSFLQVAEVLPISHRTVEYALRSDFTDKEDAILYHLALSHQVDYFVTRDKKDYPRRLQSLTQVVTPKEGTKMLKHG